MLCKPLAWTTPHNGGYLTNRLPLLKGLAFALALIVVLVLPFATGQTGAATASEPPALASRSSVPFVTAVLPV